MVIVLVISHAVAFLAGIYLHKWAAGEAAKVDAALSAARADLKSKL